MAFGKQVYFSIGFSKHSNMLKKFAINILDEVASECEGKMNSSKIPDKKAAILDDVSKMVTEALCELSREGDDSSN